jgi:hypothetical protein
MVVLSGLGCLERRYKTYVGRVVLVLREYVSWIASTICSLQHVKYLSCLIFTLNYPIIRMGTKSQRESVVKELNRERRR